MQKFPQKFILILLITIPVLVHFFLLFNFSLNFPFKDDYRVFVSYIYYFLNYQDSLQIIFLPDNESHPIIMRIITLLQFGIDKNLNFSHILYFCNLFLVLFALALALHFYRKKEYIQIAFMSLLVFNAFHFEMYFRTDVATYQLFSFASSIFLFYAATNYKELNWFTKVLFFLIFILIPFGSINGMLGNILIILYFIFNKNDKKVFITTGIILLIQLFLIFRFSAGAKSFSVLDNILRYNFELIYAYFLSMGGMFMIVNNHAIWTPVVVLSAFIFFYTFYKLFFPFTLRLNFEKLVFIFSSVSLALIVILRYNYWIQGYESVIESRYKIYGALIILLFISVLIREYPRITNYMLVPAFGIFLIGLYKGYTMIKFKIIEQVQESYNVNQGVYQNDYSRDFYVGKKKKDFLEERQLFSFKKADTFINNLIQSGTQLHSIQSSEITKADFDPLQSTDWGEINMRLKTFEIAGDFPYFNYYMVKFNGENNRSYILFLNPPPESILSKNFIHSKNLQTLSNNFYPQVVEGIDFNDFELYGFDRLKI